ncbi:MAG TPA: hypothetical protein VFQ71_00230 [Gaiellales bacterium]|jgi:hypothetical protein|nr:hypothetical protein [Gaiellales bacterium]
MTVDSARVIRFAALAGVGSTILTAAAYLTIGPNPDSDAPTASVVRYYANHHSHVYVAGILLAYAAVLFAIFGVVLWARMRDTTVNPVIAGTMLVGVAAATVSNLAYASSWYVLGDLGGKATVAAGAIQTLHISVSAGDLPGTFGLALLLLAVAVAGATASAFPRWIAVSAGLLGILSIAPVAGMIGFLTGLAILLWTAAVGISLFLHPMRHTSAGASPSASTQTELAHG